MKTLNKTGRLLLLLAALLWGCKDDPVPDVGGGDEEASELTQKVNLFIDDVMETYYYWYAELPEIDIKYEMDSEEYFYKLLYSEDKWSFITDDVEALLNSFEGTEKSFGYSLAFGKFSNTGTVFALVEFVYPDTPAAEAGLKRGDIIVLMNNADITVDNYTDLLYADNLTLTMGILTDSGISSGTTVAMSSQVLTLDPVLFTNVIEQDGHKIGYLFYAQYIQEFNTSLDAAFQYFLEEQITDLVIDLRYNPGGGTSAAQHLCSSVAPLNAVNSKSTIVTFQWNDILQEYLEEENMTSSLKVDFIDNVPVKLGLSHVYFLTGYGTASASELTITGLKPFMNVTMVGDTTYGKYTASITLEPADIYSSSGYYTEFKNWGIQPIVLRYANSLGVTDFKNGFAPEILVPDDLWSGIPLGDIEDPLLKAAVEDITGTEIIAIKKAKKQFPDFTLFDRGFSKFDANKRELIHDTLNKNIFEKNNI